VETLGTLEKLLEEVTKGNLLIHIPKKLRETKIGGIFRLIVLGIRQSIIEVRKETKSIAKSSAEISAMSQQGSRSAEMETQTVESISTSIQQVAENLREVMQNIRLQVDSLDHVFTAIEKMIVLSQDINEGVELLSSLAESTAQSIEEIYDFTKEIKAHAQSSAQISETVSNEAKDGLTSVGSVIAGIYIIKTTVEEAATAIQRLGGESERIGNILEVINDVAEQTNLLALNASIIAAQAGEHGRGFSVVANEIKGLAERTTSSTKEIAGIIQSVKTEVAQGMIAIQDCLQSVEEGVSLANQSGEVLKKIVRSIQGAKKMVSTIARATVTQAENTQQVRSSTEQVTQKLEELYTIVKNQAEESSHLTEMANVLKKVTQQIDQSAVTQLQETEAIVHSVEQIQGLVHRNANVAYRLATSSDELGRLESSLAEHIGQFLVSKHQLPRNFDQNYPGIAFVYPGAPFFFTYIYQGIQHILAEEQHFQSLSLDSQEDPVLQTEHINWLMQQSWLKGVILSPVDEHTGTQIVSDVMKHEIPLVVVDRLTKNAHFSVLSDNVEGGTCAAEMLREKISANSIVLVCGSRNITSIFNRIEGFFTKAKSYHWQVVEVFTSSLDIEQAKHSILEGFRLNPDADGIFLTNERASFAYLELIQEGNLPKRKLHAVGYDMTPKIVEAIADERLLGTIFQDPARLGSVAAQELLTLFQQPQADRSLTPKEILVPVKVITRCRVPYLV
jgi:methyl-accepting chemotaxis protein/ABC-type sugar transport system substrate-binding protein